MQHKLMLVPSVTHYVSVPSRLLVLRYCSSYVIAISNLFLLLFVSSLRTTTSRQQWNTLTWNRYLLKIRDPLQSHTPSNSHDKLCVAHHTPATSGVIPSWWHLAILHPSIVLTIGITIFHRHQRKLWCWVYTEFLHVPKFQLWYCSG